MANNSMILEGIILVIVGLSLYLMYWAYENSLRWLIKSRPSTCSKDRHRQDCVVCTQAKKCLNHLHKQAQWLHRQPELSEDVLQRLQYLLPSGTLFKEQRARLHDLAHHIHKRLMPYFEPHVSKHKIHAHLNGLNQSATEQEKRIANLHRLAENYTAVQHHKKLRSCVKVAVMLQHSNTKLLKNIYRTEKYFLSLLKNQKGLNIITGQGQQNRKV